MRLQHIDSFMYIYIFCRTRRLGYNTTHHIRVLCEVLPGGYTITLSVRNSLLFVLVILHNTPYCITKIFNISKSYLYS